MAGSKMIVEPATVVFCENDSLLVRVNNFTITASQTGSLPMTHTIWRLVCLQQTHNYVAQFADAQFRNTYEDFSAAHARIMVKYISSYIKKIASVDCEIPAPANFRYWKN